MKSQWQNCEHIFADAETESYGATAGCDEISLWEGGSAAVGYVAVKKPGSSTQFDCFAHTRERGGLVPDKSAPDPVIIDVWSFFGNKSFGPYS